MTPEQIITLLACTIARLEGEIQRQAVENAALRAQLAAALEHDDPANPEDP